MAENGAERFGNFILKGKLLYLRTIKQEQEFDRLCVPPNKRDEVLKWVHDEPLAGHLGQSRTREKATQRFYWPKMDRAEAR